MSSSKFLNVLNYKRIQNSNQNVNEIIWCITKKNEVTVFFFLEIEYNSKFIVLSMHGWFLIPLNTPHIDFSKHLFLQGKLFVQNIQKTNIYEK